MLLSAVQNEAILFPFSLKDKAKGWFNFLGARTINSWAELQQEFLKKYYLVTKTSKMRREIIGFAQNDDEKFCEAWSHFKKLIRQCLHYDIEKWQVAQSFYDGLVPSFKVIIDSACGGPFMMKSVDDA